MRIFDQIAGCQANYGRCERRQRVIRGQRRAVAVRQDKSFETEFHISSKLDEEQNHNRA